MCGMEKLLHPWLGQNAILILSKPGKAENKDDFRSKSARKAGRLETVGGVR
eukprot:COSAG02_NODE_5330_length_4431_cov_17.496307_1_plen_51_part_00